MSARTHGRLHAFEGYAIPELRMEDGTHVASLTAYQVEKARRLAACWNRLEKFTTEQIEDLGYDLFADVRPDFERAMRQRNELAARLEAGKAVWRQDQARIAELAADRDELLEALHSAIPALVECERAYRRIGAAVGQGEFERALTKVQALIAKHQPPAAPAASTT